MSFTKIRRHCLVFIETKPILTSANGGHSALTAGAWQTRSLKSDLPALGCTPEHHSCPKLVGARGRIERSGSSATATPMQPLVTSEKLELLRKICVDHGTTLGVPLYLSEGGHDSELPTRSSKLLGCKLAMCPLAHFDQSSLCHEVRRG